LLGRWQHPTQSSIGHLQSAANLTPHRNYGPINYGHNECHAKEKVKMENEGKVGNKPII
jgi:hypothetical protein